MKAFARFIFMLIYREELVDIAREVRKPINRSSDIYDQTVIANKRLGMLEALEKLNLLA